MIKKIAHLADIHIKKSIDRHQEYREIFHKLYKDLKEKKPDRIVIVGDIYDNFIDIEGEALILMGEFLNKLSNISKTIITKGNHDIRKKHKTRIDTIETVTTLINNSGITYYNKSGFYIDDNVVWVVWDHVDGLNPWKDIEHKKIKNKTYIDLYHDPINGCALYNGMRIEGKYPKIKDFKGDYSMFGDIHLRQFFDYQYTEKEINENDLEKYIKNGWKIVN
jgi:predicted MPP superfamily phosphohydrolase